MKGDAADKKEDDQKEVDNEEKEEETSEPTKAKKKELDTEAVGKCSSHYEILIKMMNTLSLPLIIKWL